MVPSGHHWALPCSPYSTMSSSIAQLTPVSQSATGDILCEMKTKGGSGEHHNTREAMGSAGKCRVSKVTTVTSAAVYMQELPVFVTPISVALTGADDNIFKRMQLQFWAKVC